VSEGPSRPPDDERVTEKPADERSLRFEQRQLEESVTVLEVRGELDIGSADALRSALDAAESMGDIIRLDATAVQFLDSTALGVMLASAQRLAARGGRLELMNASPAVRRILDMTLIARTVHLIP
jgi:anti-sigma B factor antagonist